MSKNYMKEVAQLLGVELGEEFKIKEIIDNYVINEKGLFWLEKIDDVIYPHLELNTLGDLLCGEYEIEKYILTQKEKEYLSAVIKPFKDRCVYITKTSTDHKREFISIYLGSEHIFLPYFEQGTLYKGMELDEDYSLEDLGL